MSHRNYGPGLYPKCHGISAQLDAPWEGIFLWLPIPLADNLVALPAAGWTAVASPLCCCLL